MPNHIQQETVIGMYSSQAQCEAARELQSSPTLCRSPTTLQTAGVVTVE